MRREVRDVLGRHKAMFAQYFHQNSPLSQRGLGSDASSRINGGRKSICLLWCNNLCVELRGSLVIEISAPRTASSALLDERAGDAGFPCETCCQREYHAILKFKWEVALVLQELIRPLFKRACFEFSFVCFSVLDALRHARNTFYRHLLWRHQSLIASCVCNCHFQAISLSLCILV